MAENGLNDWYMGKKGVLWICALLFHIPVSRQAKNREKAGAGGTGLFLVMVHGSFRFGCRCHFAKIWISVLPVCSPSTLDTPHRLRHDTCELCFMSVTFTVVCTVSGTKFSRCQINASWLEEWHGEKHIILFSWLWASARERQNDRP